MRVYALGGAAAWPGLAVAMVWYFARASTYLHVRHLCYVLGRHFAVEVYRAVEHPLRWGAYSLIVRACAWGGGGQSRART